jgi:hypothetical protein
MFIDAKEPFDREVLRFEGWRVWCRRAIMGDTGWEVDIPAVSLGLGKSGDRQCIS